MLDSGVSSHFIQTGKGFKCTSPSNKSIAMTSGGIMKAMGTAKLPLAKLKDDARQAIITTDLKAKALMCVSKLPDAGYTTIFHPQDKGVTVHDNDDFKCSVKSPSLLQGWR